METIEHLEHYQDYLNECKRVLKKGGLFICSTPNKGLGIPGIPKIYPAHVHEFYLEEFQEALSQFFTKINLYGQDYWHKGEGEIWGIKFRVFMAIKAHIPKLYPIIEFFYGRFILHERYIQLSQAADFDNILDENINHPACR